MRRHALYGAISKSPNRSSGCLAPIFVVVVFFGVRVPLLGSGAQARGVRRVGVPMVVNIDLSAVHMVT